MQPPSAETDVVIEQSYRRALELEPTDANVYLFYGNFLSSRGRSEEAIREYRHALGFDPLSPSANSRLGAELIGLGRTEEGLDFLLKTVAIDPWQFNARLRLGWAYASLNRLVEAERTFAMAEQISPNSVQSLVGLAFVAARQGDTARAHALLDSILPRAAARDDPFSVAIVYVGLQDRDNALEWLAETARRTRLLHREGPYGIKAPLYDWLRVDPRFTQIEHDVDSQTMLGVPVG